MSARAKSKSNRGYFTRGDRVYDAIDAIRSVRSSFIGDTIQARELILALCDQADASIEAQLAVAALLYVPDEALPPVLLRAKRKATGHTHSEYDRRSDARAEAERLNTAPKES